MKLLLPAAVFVLMMSVGMSLRLPELVENWGRHTWSGWLRLVLATFILPPVAALILARIFPLTLPQIGGLFLVAATPGAPLLTRNLARRGFDMNLAASYQVWCAVMTPIVIPVVVYFSAKLYNRNIWIPPRVVALQILEKELVPLLVGVMLVHFAPVFSHKAQRALNLLGNATLTLVLVFMLWKLGPELKLVTIWIIVSCLLVLVTSVGSMHLLMRTSAVDVRTLAVSNANRHVGLALLLSGQYMHAAAALPVVACYAIIVALLLILSPRIFKQRNLATKAVTA